MFFSLLMTSALGQSLTTRPPPPPEKDLGITANPRYAEYERIVDSLGYALRLDPTYQIAEGTVGIVGPTGIDFGVVYTTPKPPGPGVLFHRLEQTVLYEAASMDALSEGFDLLHLGPIQDSIGCEIADLAADNVATWATFVAAPHDLNYLVPPAPGQYVAANLVDPNLTLSFFDMVQSGQVQGTLCRERRDKGAAGIEWVDHWLIVGDNLGNGWKFLKAEGDSGELVPSAQVFATLQGYLGVNAPTANMYARAKYTYNTLGVLVPNPAAGCAP